MGSIPGARFCTGPAIRASFLTLRCGPSCKPGAWFLLPSLLLSIARFEPKPCAAWHDCTALYRAVRYVVKQEIPGDVVECGCARGGSAALMALTLRRLGSQRKLWLFDTFEGLPAPSSKDPDFEIADLFTGTCVGGLDEVRGLFQRLNTAENVTFVKGLFQETLPATPIQQIAVLHIDGDWYESVRVCLETLYDKVVAGGLIQLDDYGYWQGARKAVDEFLARRGIRTPLQRLDYSGRFLIKPESTQHNVS